MADIKLQDVATAASVSLATASLALSGKGRISSEVRARVREAAEKLGYRTKSSGRTLQTLRGVPVGILHAEGRAYEWNFLRPTILELERCLRQKGCLPVLVPVPESGDHVVQTVLDAGARAVFCLQAYNEKVLTDLHKRSVRVIVINNSSYQHRFSSVCVDDFQGAYEGTLALFSLGHRVIAFVEYERPESPAVVADRFIGFRKALEERHAAFSAEQRVTIPFMDAKRLSRRLESIFSRPARPTAVFAHDDYLGLYVISALRELGLEVPRDVSLVAPGDVLDYSLPLMPQITTMRIDTQLLGRLAVNLLADALRGEEEQVHVLKLKEQFVMRQSCRSLEED
jgi:LacI family transcriptional regulator